MGQGWLEDLRLARRSLSRDPRFTGLVAGVLAVGIAMTCAVYAVVEAYLFAPLPFPHDDRIVTVVEFGDVGWDEVEDVFETAVSWDLDGFTIVGDGAPELVRGSWVTPGFLDTYGVVPALGRRFRDEEVGRDAAPVAMISHDLWVTRFASDPDIVGTTFQAFTSDRADHAESFEIVGVLPEDFWYINTYTDVLAPIRGSRALYAGRLREDVPLEQAEQILTEISLANGLEAPPDFRVRLLPLKESYVGPIRPTLVAMQGAVLLALLVAMANGGVLFLIRTSARRDELAVRRALGASVGRLARQLLAEGAVVALAAGLIGTLLAAWGLRASRESLATSLGRAVPGGLESVSLDASVVAVTVVLCVGIALAFGTLPLIAGHGRRGPSLREEWRGRSDSRAARHTRGALVATEVALSLALLTGAALMARSAVHLQERELGFDPEGVVGGEVGLRAASYPDAAGRVTLFSSLVEQVEHVPGVESASVATRDLFTGRLHPSPIEGRRVDGVQRAEAIRWPIGEGYFETLGIRLVQGRAFERTDAAGAEPVVVVSQRLADRLWPGEPPVGQLLRMSGSPADDIGSEDVDPWRRVVGVTTDLTGELRPGPHGFVFEPYRQGNPQWMNLMVRGSLTPQEMRRDIGAVLAGLDPEAPLYDVGFLSDAVDEALAPARDFATLLVLFAGFAFCLAVLGLSGVVSYAARQGRRAVAIRMMLGADGVSVTTHVVKETLVVVGVGLLLGWAGGQVVAWAIAAQLHGVGAGDAFTHSAVAVALGLATLLAAWLPAHAASRVEPMTVLKDG